MDEIWEADVESNGGDRDTVWSDDSRPASPFTSLNNFLKLKEAKKAKPSPSELSDSDHGEGYINIKWRTKHHKLTGAPRSAAINSRDDLSSSAINHCST